MSFSQAKAMIPYCLFRIIFPLHTGSMPAPGVRGRTSGVWNYTLLSGGLIESHYQDLSSAGFPVD
ncbi:hypothetical protein ACFVHQ_08385 [Actinomycetes bacterium NPDC127524]